MVQQDRRHRRRHGGVRLPQLLLPPLVDQLSRRPLHSGVKMRRTLHHGVLLSHLLLLALLVRPLLRLLRRGVRSRQTLHHGPLLFRPLLLPLLSQLLLRPLCYGVPSHQTLRRGAALLLPAPQRTPLTIPQKNRVNTMPTPWDLLKVVRSRDGGIGLRRRSISSREQN